MDEADGFRQYLSVTEEARLNSLNSPRSGDGGDGDKDW